MAESVTRRVRAASSTARTVFFQIFPELAQPEDERAEQHREHAHRHPDQAASAGLGLVVVREREHDEQRIDDTSQGPEEREQRKADQGRPRHTRFTRGAFDHDRVRRGRVGEPRSNGVAVLERVRFGARLLRGRPKAASA